MIVFDPNNTNHVFDIIARQSVPETVNFVIYNKQTTEETSQIPVVTKVSDKTRFRISLSCLEGESYSFKIVDADGLVYARGKVFVTAQEPQNYSSDNGLYTYSTI